MRHLLIDTDTASDDAVALVMALRAPDVTVDAVTVVSGNVPLEQGLANALYTVELCARSGADYAATVPVHAGAPRPLLREPSHADWFHGRDGLGDMNYPRAALRPASAHAVDAIIEACARQPDIELVTLGPLTNVALALSREPSLITRISRCVVMGGNPCCVGNVTPAAEYNIWCDPEAAAIVFRSGLNIELVGWQLCRGEANLRAADIDAIRKLDNELAHFTIDCNRVAMEANRKQSGEVGIALPDPVAMAVALEHRTIVRRASRHRVEVECHSELTRGMTVVDQLNVGNDQRNRGMWSSPAATGHGEGGASATPRARRDISVIWEIDIPKWKQLLLRSLMPGDTRISHPSPTARAGESEGRASKDSG
jgi:purine nucleosidase